MSSKIKYTWWNPILGLLVVVVGFIGLILELRRPSAERRTWVVVVTIAMLIIGTIYSLGLGDILLVTGVSDLVSKGNNNP